jgi:hypothetical protein
MGMLAETAIFDYHFSLLTKENKQLFPVSVCSKQTEVCHFQYSFFRKQTKVAVFR